MSDRNAASKRVAADASLGTGGTADGGAMGDAGVGEEVLWILDPDYIAL